MAFSINGSFTEAQIKKLNEISGDSANETRKKSQKLDKDAFLKLMMIQLQNQDPLSPTDNTQYMNQMAQFSSVEQLTNIAELQQTTVDFNALISKQLEDMTKAIEKLAGKTDETVKPATTDTTSTPVKAQQVSLEQDTKLLDELVKMNAMLSSYMGQTDTDQTVSDEDIFSILGQ